MDLLEVWEGVDAEINATLAMALSTLAFAAATFMTGWVKTKEGEVIAHVGNDEQMQRARHQLIHAKKAIKDLLLAFVAFSFLLGESIVVDPIAIAGTDWSNLTILDSITASGGLAVGLSLFLKAAWHIHASVEVGHIS